MLFFIAAFSNRDKTLGVKENITYVLDRFSYIDIKVYIDTLLELSHINREEYNSLISVLNQSFSKKIMPSYAFL